MKQEYCESGIVGSWLWL